MIIQLENCEICGSPKSKVALHDHHMKHRAAGGLDIPENVIKVCGECHTLCHAGNIKLWKQIEIVASREGKTTEEICEAIGLLVDKILPKDYIFEDQSNPLQGMSLDEVLQTYYSYEEIGETAVWGQARILCGMADSGIEPKKIAGLVGCSSATVRERVRTFRAFPEESMRAKDKSFTHHRLASKTDDPGKWLDIVCEQGLSTRQLAEAIKGDEKGNGDVIEEDIQMEKAERIIRMTEEVFTSGTTKAVNWLYNEIISIIRKRSETAYGKAS